jgi:hypothetical protein
MRPNELALARIPVQTALTRRLRPTCWAAMRAAMANFCPVETFGTRRFYQFSGLQYAHDWGTPCNEGFGARI